MPRKKKAETTAEAVAAAEIAASEAEIKEKKPGKKHTVNKAIGKEPKETVMIQFAGREYDLEAIKAAVKADYKEKVSGKVKLLDIYIKPEDGMAYYVVNEITGKVQL